MTNLIIGFVSGAATMLLIIRLLVTRQLRKVRKRLDSELEAFQKQMDISINHDRNG